MIKVKQVSKQFGDLLVLDDVNLSIAKNEIVSIVGPSGAGKSTLLQIMGTLEQASEGQVIYDGQDIAELSKRKLAEFRNKQIGFIFQFHHLLPEFNALENVCIPGFIAGNSRQQVEKQAKELLGVLGLSNRLDHKPGELSGGEQQRVAAARALINEPMVVFADEPSGNLDSENAEQLHRLFEQLRNELQQTFVIVTHNKELAAVADRTIRMRDGRVI